MNFQDIYEKLTELCERMAAMEATHKIAMEQISETKHAVGEIQANANRLKGGFMFVIMLGSIAGSVATAWYRMKHLFNGS